MPNPTIALWATNIARPLGGLEDWLALVDDKLASAKSAGAQMLVMPEYAAAHWLAYRPDRLAPSEEIAWMAAEAAHALTRLPSLAQRHGVALLAGTMPVAGGTGSGADRHRNRAHLFLEDGRIVVQDKLCLTPAEKDLAAWQLEPGTVLREIDWRGLKLAILICLDVELPALSAMLAGRALDLILVPSMTSKQSGYHRVFGCAKARAVELQAILCVVGTIGTQPSGDTNYSGAAAFVPCKEILGHDGLFATVAPRGDDSGDGPMLIARDLPVDVVRRLRGGAAEVWPGAWRPDGLTISPA